MFKCSKCGILKPIENFIKDKRRKSGRRSSCYSCKYLQNDKNSKARLRLKESGYFKKYYKNNPLIAKVKAYRTTDKKLNMPSITIVEARILINDFKICYYCTSSECLGLDRKNNNRGHSLDNVVVCCEKCNNILGDLPQEVKELLVLGLTEAYKKGHLKTWNIPTKRKHLGAV